MLLQRGDVVCDLSKLDTEVMNTYATAEDSTERLRHALRVAGTSEQVGAETLDDLHTQRQQLIGVSSANE